MVAPVAARRASVTYAEAAAPPAAPPPPPAVVAAPPVEPSVAVVVPPRDVAAELAFVSGLLADARKRAAGGVGDQYLEELEVRQWTLKEALNAERPLPARLQSAMDKALTRKAAQQVLVKEAADMREQLRLKEEAVAAAVKATDEAELALQAVQREAAAAAADSSEAAAGVPPTLASVQADLNQVVVALGARTQESSGGWPPAVLLAIREGLLALNHMQHQLTLLAPSAEVGQASDSLGGDLAPMELGTALLGTPPPTPKEEDFKPSQGSVSTPPRERTRSPKDRRKGEEKSSTKEPGSSQQSTQAEGGETHGASAAATG